METKAYRIVDWQSHYENNRTRDMKIMAWVPVPVKHDGYGYCRLVAELGAAGLGAWLAILQTAAKSHPRGTLLRDTFTPHTATSISITTRIDAKIIQKTLDLCCSPDIKWIEVVELQGDIFLPAEIPHLPAEIPHLPARNGMEGKGIEGNGKTCPQAGDGSVPARCNHGSEADYKTKHLVSAQKHGELGNVLLTNEDYDKLKAKHNATELAMGIEILDSYLAQPRNARRYKNHYAVLKETSWVWDRVKEKIVNQRPRTSDLDRRIADTERRYREAVS
jgi:hypothetical protein